MNIRFDKDSLRVRVSREEALRLNEEKALSELYPAGGFRLDVETTKARALRLEVSPQHDYRLEIPEAQLSLLLEKMDQPQAKKKDFCIRESMLIFEVDFFK